MLKRGLFLFLLLALGMESCSGQQKTDAKVNATEEPVQKERTFQLPEVPSMLVTPEDRAIYVVQHYWDHFDFSDTAYIHLPDVTEQAMVNFMDLMYHIPASEIEPALETLYGKAAPHAPMLWHFWETMSRYWNDANSPVRDEDMFIRLCRSVEATPQVEETLKQRALFARKLAEKNRVGMKATDFTYTMATGKQARLSSIRSPYTLLLFFDPDCHTCNAVKDAMKTSERLAELIQSKQLTLLTIYPDEDIDLWRSRLPQLPKEWIHAYDKGQVLTHEELYDLSSMPSFYLLDAEKKVLLKDAGWGQIEEALYRIP